MFFITDWYAKPTFAYEIVGDRLRARSPSPARAWSARRSQLRWDIDGDGTPDADPNTGHVYDTPELYVRLGDTRTRVTLFIDDPITRKTVKVTRVIRLDAAARRWPPARRCTEGK